MNAGVGNGARIPFSIICYVIRTSQYEMHSEGGTEASKTFLSTFCNNALRNGYCTVGKKCIRRSWFSKEFNTLINNFII